MTVDRSGYLAASPPAVLVGVGGDVSHPTAQQVIQTIQTATGQPMLAAALLLEPVDRDAPPGPLPVGVVGTPTSWAHLIACLERQVEETGNGPALLAALDQEREHVRTARWGAADPPDEIAESGREGHR